MSFKASIKPANAASHLYSQTNEKVEIPLIIREATGKDFQDIMRIERDAFGEDDEANLVAKLRAREIFHT